VQQQTLTYLFTRPISRWKVVVGKWSANVLLLGAGSLASLVASWLLLAPREVPLLIGLGVATAVATVAYNAIFTLFGAIFSRRTLLIGLVYAILLEFLLSLVPAVVNTLTVTYYLRSMVVEIADINVRELPSEVRRIIGDATVPESLAVTALVALVTLALASAICARREFTLTEEP
jgi:ABC-type transport system involved in multi-copper enzyme maturation permease subunit